MLINTLDFTSLFTKTLQEQPRRQLPRAAVELAAFLLRIRLQGAAQTRRRFIEMPAWKGKQLIRRGQGARQRPLRLAAAIEIA